MTPAWAEKLKTWERRKDEAYAKRVMAKPEKTTLLHTIPHPGVVVIMGDQGGGKTALAYEIMDQLHKKRNLGGALLFPAFPPRKVLARYPKWVRAYINLEELPPG
ncbi:MAG: hypothetical protein Q7R39_08075, partial [Dehalococcoidia bacterium]|nr:hypothetical protein [Dehalococcoidia bacterium]